MAVVRKYLWKNPTYDDLQWIMTAFDRRCEVQSVPEYSSVYAFGRAPMDYLTQNNTYITIMNDDDNLFFTIKYPDATLIETTIS